MGKSTILLTISILIIATISYADVETEPNSNRETADALTSGSPMKAHIMSDADEDWYSISVTEPDAFEVKFYAEYYERHTTSYKHYQFEVQDSNGSTLVKFEIEDTYYGIKNYNVGVAEAGTYYFVIKPPDIYYNTDFYEFTVTATNTSPGCIGECSAEKLQEEYNKGYADGLAVECNEMYTQDEVNRIIKNILTWGDTNGDNKIGLDEAINALQITAGATPIK